MKHQTKINKIVGALSKDSSFSHVFYDEPEGLIVAQYRGSQRGEFDLLVEYIDGEKVKAWIEGPMQSKYQITVHQGGGSYSPALYFKSAFGAAKDAVANPHWHGR